jgi:hypothetical protein
MSPVALHTVFEALAYMIGFRTFLWTRRRLAPAAFEHDDHAVWIGVVGAIVGAAVGAKLAFWMDDPLVAFAGFPDLRHLLEGKSIVVALLGGLIAVELTKKITKVNRSSGDAFVLPLTVGMCIGRVRCFLAGLGDVDDDRQSRRHPRRNGGTATGGRRMGVRLDQSGQVTHRQRHVPRPVVDDGRAAPAGGGVLWSDEQLSLSAFIGKNARSRRRRTGRTSS